MNALCHHCGNRVPLTKLATFQGLQLYEHIDQRKYHEAFEYHVFQCPTCSGVSMYGDFEKFPVHNSTPERRLYPSGARLEPESHKVDPDKCIPTDIVALYDEILPLRHIAPMAFASQIRRALEMICKDQKASGRTLFEKVRDLSARGTFPGYFAEMTDLLRKLGNQGAHAGDSELDHWDMELLDDFFRSIVEYVYVAPAKIRRLKQRIAIQEAK